MSTRRTTVIGVAPQGRSPNPAPPPIGTRATHEMCAVNQAIDQQRFRHATIGTAIPMSEALKRLDADVDAALEFWGWSYPDAVGGTQCRRCAHRLEMLQARGHNVTDQEPK